MAFSEYMNFSDIGHLGPMAYTHWYLNLKEEEILNNEDNKLAQFHLKYPQILRITFQSISV